MPNQPTSAQVHVDRPLTNLSVAYQQDRAHFVAANVFPTVPVNHQSDLYNIYPKGAFYRTGQVKPRGLGQRPRAAGYELTNDRYVCEEYALEHLIDDRVSRNADPTADPEVAGTMFLTEQGLINRETLWTQNFFTSGVWSLDYVGVSSGPSTDQFLQWDQSGANPIEQVRQLLNKVWGTTGFRPNSAVFGPTAFEGFTNNADVVDRIKYTQRGIVTPEIVASLLDIDHVYIAGGVSNTAVEGQDDSISFIADSDSVLLAYSAPAPSLYAPSAGYQFAWVGLIPGLDNSYGGVIERGRDELAHTDVLQIRQSFDQKQVASDLGVFLSSAVSSSYGS